MGSSADCTGTKTRAGAVKDEAVHNAPRGAAVSGYGVPQRAQGCVLVELVAEVVEEVEGWS